MRTKSTKTAPRERNDIGHMLAPNSPDCPGCGAPPEEHEVRNYNLDFHDGDVYCTRCDGVVRYYDAG